MSEKNKNESVNPDSSVVKADASTVQNKGQVTIEVKATFILDESKLQCLNGNGITVSSVTTN